MGLQGYVGSSQDETRIHRQEKEREDERKRIAELKKETEAKVISAGLRRFGTGTSEVLDNAFKNETVGLVTREEFLKRRDSVEEKYNKFHPPVLPNVFFEDRFDEKSQKVQSSFNGVSKKSKTDSKKQKRKEKTTALLSFNEEEEDIEEESLAHSAPPKQTAKKQRLSKYGKCPTVETEFLPDIDREREQARMREELKREWKKQQESTKAEDLKIVYSYWDGTGHRRSITVKKGTTIGEFLTQVRGQLSKDFRELRAASIDNLLYVKEDVIIPHSYTFYDLIICKARGKSGPLFNFDVHDDIRILNDAGIEKQDSHAGKVVERHWYDRNKHIFPASRWQIYDPDKPYETYTIH